MAQMQDRGRGATKIDNALERRSGPVAIKAEVLSSRHLETAEINGIEDWRQTRCDANIVQELLTSSIHVPVSTWVGRLPTSGVKFYLEKYYPRASRIWSRWTASLLPPILANPVRKRTKCHVCHNASESFFANLSIMTQAAERYGCVHCGLLVGLLSIFLRPIEGGVLWATRGCGRDSIWVLVDIVDGLLKELRIWNFYSRHDRKGHGLAVLGQLWIEVGSALGKSTFLDCVANV